MSEIRLDSYFLSQSNTAFLCDHGFSKWPEVQSRAWLEGWRERGGGCWGGRNPQLGGLYGVIRKRKCQGRERKKKKSRAEKTT